MTKKREITTTMIKQTLAVAALVAAGATFAVAQGATGSAALSERKDLMKEISKGEKPVVAVTKGEAPFELAKAQAWFKTVESNVTKFKGLFPADSKDGETRAAPAIWEKKADFDQAADKVIAAAKTAQVETKDEASLKEQYKLVDDSCNACHKVFRTSRR
jgi:cytochrome c556